MALLAYEEPEKSPMFHLLSPEYRQNVADSLNRAVLGMFKDIMASSCNINLISRLITIFLNQ
jgi:hypothetical protein